MVVNVLGTEYEIIFEDFGRDNRDGYCSVIDKKIHIDTQITNEDRKRIVLRHEIMHAFFFESGLENYFYDEQLISFIALQFDKIEKVFKEIKIDQDKIDLDQCRVCCTEDEKPCDSCIHNPLNRKEK